MKLVIDHSETKREIFGPFKICGSREDIKLLATQLASRLNDESWSYGWTVIHESMPGDLVNTKPTHWDE